MADDWRKDDNRRTLTLELAKAMDECEGLGDLAEQVEKQCYAGARSREEYLANLASVLRGADRHVKCDICIFLERVTESEWNLVGDIEF